MSLIALLLACASSPPLAQPNPPPEPAVADFARPVPGPISHAPIEGMEGVKGHIQSVTTDGRSHRIRLQPVVRAGQEIDGAIYGRIPTPSGAPPPWPPWYPDPPEGPFLCNVIDFTSLVHTDHGWFHLAHLECVLGGVVVSPIRFEPEGGVSLGRPRPVDFAPLGGTTTNCAGDVTPWNTHLASEEYEANARMALPDGRLPPEQMDVQTKHPFEWSFLNRLAEVSDTLSPYRYGWIPEIAITGPDGSATAVKHYAMGRFSHELAVVLPDRRTVYLSDDQYHGAFFLFVADRAEDLSAGTLYAARWQQASDRRAELSWVNLGHATDAEIGRALEEGIRFEDLFDAAPLSDEGTCPEGFGRTTTTWGTECLRVLRPTLASRLESRRYAGLKGATTELSKSEGLAVDPGSSGPASARLYLASSKITAGMLDEQQTVRGPGDYRRSPESDHLRLPENRCGAVWRMEPGEAVDRAGQPIDSAYVMRRAEIALAGVPEGERACAESAIANPDNITFAEPYGWLLIAEDTRAHQADLLWAVDERRPGSEPVRLVEVDPASEVTGIHWYEVEGQGYISLSNQWDPDDWPEHPSVAALLGPFPLPE